MDTNKPNPETDVNAQNPETDLNTQTPESPAPEKMTAQTNDAVQSESSDSNKPAEKAEKQPQAPAPDGQRTVLADKLVIAKILEKFPLFKGLSAYQYQQILTICTIRVFEKGAVVCNESDNSKEMFILISGELQVMYHKNTVLTTIKPISLVGELVFFTSEQGFSSVVASADSTVISIPRDDLFHFLKRDSGLSFNILMNVIRELAKKLRKNDEIIDELKKK